MKKITDEQIQALLESELRPSGEILLDSEKEQLQSYRSLFQKLNTEPEQGLPFNFASKVTSQLKLKLKRRNDIRFNLLAVLGIIIGLVAAYGLLIVIDLNAGKQFLLVILKFKWLVIFSLFILLSSLVFDQQMVEKN
ncbi:hypothetical protein [Mucilaginibacter sp. FT3.2]|uniref:hypothetical protein n=1 Tax=Mucilaginibacter sp. FT3.2 TaxID=2723090 RepID=UPI001622D339|nr:hypothetical protein [Mucilaginibacter sp. FT3.2]MBB6232990.1 hypothetical protein [Mucilaginibacter sp. FT3.2]